jgi:hypothetical protein
MLLRRLSPLYLLFGVAATLLAQVQQPVSSASPDVVARIPANYDQAKVDTYVLPGALTLVNGQRAVRDAKTWWAKRRALVQLSRLRA